MAGYQKTSEDEKREYELDYLAKLIYSEAAGVLLGKGDPMSPQTCAHLCSNARRVAIEYMINRPLAKAMLNSKVNPDEPK